MTPYEAVTRQGYYRHPLLARYNSEPDLLRTRALSVLKCVRASLVEAVALAGEGVRRALALPLRGRLLRRGRLQPCQAVVGVHHAVVGHA